MASRAPSVCEHGGCGSLAAHGRHLCPKHIKQHTRETESHLDRSTSYLYATAAWRKLRALQLQEQPLCEDCVPTHEATEVDHIVPHRGNRDLFFSRSNLQSLCKSAHSRKTARERLSR